MQVRTQGEGENFIHVILWDTVERQLDHAKRQPKGALLDDLAAMVFMFHAFESYLNFVGSKLAPDFWKKERDHFRATGFAGKVAKVFELCGVHKPPRSERPYRTIWDLKILRDKIAHGHVQTLSYEYEHSRDDEVPLMRGAFDDIVSAERAKIAFDDVYEVAKKLHAAARQKTADLWFGDDPFDNISGHASNSTSSVRNT